MDIKTIEVKYDEELVEFYKPFFLNKEETQAFIAYIYDYDWNDRIPRRMINQIYRFVTLATRVEQIWPARDGLRILFIKTCLESLCYLSSEKKEIFYSTFPSCFSNKGTEWILSHFRLTKYTDCIDGIEYEACYDLTMSDFLEIIKTIRDKVAHDGNYWETQLFAYGDDKEVNWLTTLESEKRLLANRTLPKTKRITEYHFETSLYFEDFVFYFTEACIYYVKKYINNLKKDEQSD